MEDFQYMLKKLYAEFGEAKTMVLSTSFKDKVSSRMMSVILIDGIFYFQTDKCFRKYEQLKVNPFVALCIDNIQIEGICKEVGVPLDNDDFKRLYCKHFSVSFQMYSALANERLFCVKPCFIQRWIYKNGNPIIEIFDCEKNEYLLQEYSCI